MKPVKIVTKAARELLMDKGATGVNEAFKNFTSQCIKDGVGPATAAALAVGGTAALPFIGLTAMILGPILWEIHKDKKLDDKLSKFQEIIDRMAGDASNAASFSAKTDRMLEELVDGKRPVWARLNGLDKQQISEAVTKETRGLLKEMLETIGVDFPEVLDHLVNIQTLVFDMNFIVRRLETTVIEGFERIEAQLPAIADLQEKVLRLAEANAGLAMANAGLTSTNSSLHEHLMNANRELAEQRLAAGRSVDEVLAELRQTDPHELFAFLRTQIDDDEAEYEKNRSKLIARHREIATIGYPLGKIDEAMQSLHRLLELIPGDLDAINRLGHIHTLRGELSESVTCYQQVFDADAGKESIAVALGNLGYIEQIRGNFDRAKEYHMRSLAIEEELNSKEGTAAQLGNLGSIEQVRGNLDDAKDYLMRSLLLYVEIGHKIGEVNVLSGLGLIEQIQGNLDCAQKYHTQSLNISKTLNYKEGIGSQLTNIGLIEHARGNLDVAEDFHRNALELFTVIGGKEGMAAALGNLGMVEWARENYKKSEIYHRQSLAINEGIHCKIEIATNLTNLGLVDCDRGSLDRAVARFTRSLCINQEIENKKGMAINYGNLGLVEMNRGDLKAARDYLGRALELNNALGRIGGEAIQLANLGLIENDCGNNDEACKFWRRSLVLYEEIGAAPMVERVSGWLAKNGCD